MARCKRIGPSKRKLCVGDLRELIAFKVRFITPPADVNYDNTFGALISVYAAIETVNGQSLFDNVSGQDIPITHKFYIRFIDNAAINTESWVEFQGNNYKILTLENVDERNQYLIIRASLKGPANIVANRA